MNLQKSPENEAIEDHEDGEISDDEDDAPVELPINQPTALINYPSSDDEEKSPEEFINAYKKRWKKETNHRKLKFLCPRCDIRTCSLDCSKKHKEEKDCDGVRQPFSKVEKLSQYDSQKSIDDQKFMHKMKERAGLGAEYTTSTNNEINTADGEEKPFDPNALRCSTNSPTERYLINAARFRHIWLGFTDIKENGSRHEQHSDTIFWSLKLTFKKQNADGSVEIFEKTVTNIPETIRLVTVLKQFFKPRQYGCIVSESDLDIEKLKPFIDRGIDEVNVYMEVHGNQESFYGIIQDKTILEMTRNRVVADFPKFVITLKDEFIEGMPLLTSEELEQIQSKYGGVAVERSGGSRGRGGRGFHRGGGRGGQNHQNNFKKRPAQGGGHDGSFKRGRGGSFNSNRRGGYQNRNNQHIDTFDPFEPFSGPNRLPMEYN
uniref:BCD1 alpha/beta domain-containing protein n=1 Tax=Caenorhabditis tropicalis TaxID=1561998 RepID=A0A1I7V006_9PELO